MIVDLGSDLGMGGWTARAGTVCYMGGRVDFTLCSRYDGHDPSALWFPAYAGMTGRSTAPLDCGSSTQ